MLKNGKTGSPAFSFLIVSAITCIVAACVVSTATGPFGYERLQGHWFVDNANYPGKIEFHWDGQGWRGRIWIDHYARWEELTEIVFDPRTGELRFFRPAFHSPYTGTLSGDQIVGSFVYQGISYPWRASRR